MMSGYQLFGALLKALPGIRSRKNVQGKLVYGEQALHVSCACVRVGRGGPRGSGKLAW